MIPTAAPGVPHHPRDRRRSTPPRCPAADLRQDPGVLTKRDLLPLRFREDRLAATDAAGSSERIRGRPRATPA